MMSGRLSAAVQVTHCTHDHRMIEHHWQFNDDNLQFICIYFRPNKPILRKWYIQLVHCMLKGN